MKHVLVIGISALLITGAPGYANAASTEMSAQMGEARDDLAKLPEHMVAKVKPTEIIELKDGDIYELEAAIVVQEVGNRSIKRLAYNGQIPGPVLKVQKGAQVTIKFTNNIDMETALHSHGLRGDWWFDGAPPITPAVGIGETFSYELKFPDTGVYWYHPHVREDYQQELGLYGNMIVEEDGYWNDVAQEEYLILDDYLENGTFSREFVSNTLMGRFGDSLLINDQADFSLDVTQGEVVRLFLTNVANTRTFNVVFEGADTKLVGGDIGRIENEVMVEDLIIAPAQRYIVEVLYEQPGTFPIMHRGQQIGTVSVQASDAMAPQSFAELRTNDADYQMIRSQQSALVARAPDKNLRLDINMEGMGMDHSTMAEGMDHSAMTEASDDTAMAEGMDHSTMAEGMDHSAMTETSDDTAMAEGMDHSTMAEGMDHSAMTETSDDTAMAEGMDHSTMDHSAMAGGDGIEWEDDMAAMNQMSTDETVEWIIEDTDTGKKNGAIDWTFNQDDLVKVRVYNDENGMHPMQHPIHFHGQRFVVLSRDENINDNLQWIDTVLIPRGQTVDLLVDMSNPGKWMAHCHIAEHLHAGMMFHFEVN